MCVQNLCVHNLKFVALPIPEIIGGTQKIGQSLDTPMLLFSLILNGLLFGWTLSMYVPHWKFVPLPVPEIIAIAVLGWGCEPQCWGRGGRKGSDMVPFEKALMSSYGPLSRFHAMSIS